MAHIQDGEEKSFCVTKKKKKKKHKEEIKVKH